MIFILLKYFIKFILNKMPPKYYKGLSEKEKKEKKENIKDSKKLYDAGKKKQAFKKASERPTIKSTKKSSYTTRFNKKFPDVKSPPSKSFADATGISIADQKIILNRGKAAFATSGSRSSVSSPTAWSIARLYAFYFKALGGGNKINQDQDIYDKLKGKIK